MKRINLEHIIKSVTSILNTYEVIVIGSQSILGAYPDAPEELLRSEEADVIPMNNSEQMMDLIDGTIGEESPFHKNFGYYAQGVSKQTAYLPINWEDRLIKIQNENTDLKIGYCLEPHDLAVSKLIAHREKDLFFINFMISKKMLNMKTLKERLNAVPTLDETKKKVLDYWIDSQVIGKSKSKPKPF